MGSLVFLLFTIVLLEFRFKVILLELSPGLIGVLNFTYENRLVSEEMINGLTHSRSRELELESSQDEDEHNETLSFEIIDEVFSNEIASSMIRFTGRITKDPLLGLFC